MNIKIIYRVSLIVPAILLFTGCGGTDKSFIPVTGADEVTVPAMVELTRGNVLKYLSAFSRLATVPSNTEWQPTEKQFDGQYRYRSGDWLMVIWYGGAGAENQRIVLINAAENIYWCGYVGPEGKVVDTSFEP
jgi:hypothetical protein